LITTAFFVFALFIIVFGGNCMERFEFDFSKTNILREGFIGTFGITLKQLLKKMFGGEKVPIIVKGKPKEIRAFAKALVREKDYYSVYKKYGLNDPRTYRSKYRLKRAIHDFERKTRIKWPLKFR
tara:strand:- start:327 stop:701 length:375 start_codon:yes stop_codon:yes gene_type:complete